MTKKESELSIPQDIASEEFVIGSLIMAGEEALNLIDPILEPSNFYSERCMLIYRAVMALYQRSEKINLITIKNELSSQKTLETVGGESVLHSLLGNCGTWLDVDSYGKNVYRLSQYRRLIVASEQIKSIGYNADSDLNSSLEKADDILYKFNDVNGNNNGFVHIKEPLNEIWDNATNPTGLTEIATGFYDLDGMIEGFETGELTVLAARPSMGKTALATNIAINVAKRQTGVAFYSLEMTRKQLLIRMLSGESKIDYKTIHYNLKRKLKGLEWNFTSEQENKFANATGVISELPIYIDDTNALRPMEIRNRFKKLSHQHEIGLIIIDHLGMIRSDIKTENKVQEIGYIVNQIKYLAKEYQIPVLLLSQLSRALTLRTEKRPVLTDLRESGDIEQTADVVMFIYRDDYYKLPTDKKDNMAEIIIAKQRNGETGSVKLQFTGLYTLFQNLAKKENGNEESTAI